MTAQPDSEPEETESPTGDTSAEADDSPQHRPEAKRLRADKAAQALHSQWAQEDANRTARQREADLERWRDVR